MTWLERNTPSRMHWISECPSRSSPCYKPWSSNNVSTLEKRICKFTALNVRSEIHGDEPVTAIDLGFSEYLVVKAELNHLMREPHAHDVLFDESGVGMGGRVMQPVFQHLKPLQLKEKIEGCSITITYGVGAEALEFTAVTLNKVTFEPRVGGMTATGLQAQLTPDLDGRVLDILGGLLNKQVELEIDLGEFGKQQALPLEAEKPKRGRRKAQEQQPEAAAGTTH